MLKSKRINDLMIISVGPFGSAAASIVLVLLLSWFFMPETLALVAIMELVALFFVMAFTFGFDQAYVREYAETSDKGKLFTSAMVVPFLFCILSGLTLAVVLPVFNQSILPEMGVFGTQVAIAYGMSSLLVRLMSTCVRMSKSPEIFSALQLTQRMLTLVALIICLFLAGIQDAKAVILCYLAGSWISVLLHAVVCRSEIARMMGGAVDRGLLASLFRFGWPTALGAIFYALLASSDRISLAFFGTSRDLGVYSVAVSIAGTVSIFTLVFGIIWAPLVYQNEAQGAERSAIVPYMEIIVLLVFLASNIVAAAAWILPNIFPPDYAEVAYFVPACMALPVLYILSESFGIGIALSRKTGFAIVANAIGATVAVATSFILVPFQGAAGAALAILAGSLAFLVARTEFSTFLWCQFPRKKMYVCVAAYCVGCLASLLFGARLGWLFPAYWLLSCVLVLILYRQRFPLFRAFINEAIGRR